MDYNYAMQCDFYGISELPKSVNDWELDYVQTDPGELESDILALHSGTLQIAYGFFDKGMIQAGTAPKGYRTFKIMSDPKTSCMAYGSTFAGSEILAVPASRELDIVTGSDHSNFNISLPTGELETLSDNFGCDNLLGQLNTTNIFRPSPVTLTLLQQTLRQVDSHARKGCSPSDFASIREDVLSAFFSCFSTTSGVRDLTTPKLRRQVVQRALEFIRAGGRENISITALCEVTGASRRTLFYAFRQYLGITPSAYIKAVFKNSVALSVFLNSLHVQAKLEGAFDEETFENQDVGTCFFSKS